MTSEWIVNVPGDDWSDPVFGLTPRRTRGPVRPRTVGLAAVAASASLAVLVLPFQWEPQRAPPTTSAALIDPPAAPNLPAGFVGAETARREAVQLNKPVARASTRRRADAAATAPAGLAQPITRATAASRPPREEWSALVEKSTTRINSQVRASRPAPAVAASRSKGPEE